MLFLTVVVLTVPWNGLDKLVVNDRLCVCVAMYSLLPGTAHIWTHVANRGVCVMQFATFLQIKLLMTASSRGSEIAVSVSLQTLLTLGTNSAYWIITSAVKRSSLDWQHQGILLFHCRGLFSLVPRNQ